MSSEARDAAGADEVEAEWACDFHGISYVVTVETKGPLLLLSAEETESGERWRGEFTMQYVEEISQKAGSYKKFSVFVRMLCSALSRDSESVFVDLLTYNDLELLKARKTGSVNSSTSSLGQSTGARNHAKRYLILTYAGEFDRVHFPLPLVFEETPDVGSLMRTIARLKRSLADKTANELEQSVSKEDRSMVTQLRQENTELRHRLRNLESRMLPSGAGAAAASSVAASQQNGEVLLAYSKLKRQLESTRKELHTSTLAYERLRTESAKEITKLKLQIVSGPSSKFDTLESVEIIRKLRSQCSTLKQQLETERTEHKRCIVRHQRELANLKHMSNTYPSRGNRSLSPVGTGTGRRPASGLPPRPTSAVTARASQTKSLSKDSGGKMLRRSSSPGQIPSASDSRSKSSTGYSGDGRRPPPGSRSPSPAVDRPPWNAGSRGRAAGRYESGYSSATSQSSAGSRRSRGSARSGASGASSHKSGRSDGKRSSDKKTSLESLLVSEDDAVEESGARKRKSSKKSKEKKKSKDRSKRLTSALDYEIIGDSDGADDLLRGPAVVSSPRRRDGDRDHMNSSVASGRSSADVPIRRSDQKTREDNRHSSVNSSRDSRASDGLFVSPALQHAVMGSDVTRVQRLNPNDFPVSRAVDAMSNSPTEEEDVLSRAFDGLSMAKRNNNSKSAPEASLRRSTESVNSVDSSAISTSSLRRSREAVSSSVLVGATRQSSTPVVITRAGPPRAARGSRDRDEVEQAGEEDNGASGGENDISEIDKRIKALQAFLDKARSGIIGDDQQTDS